MFRKGIFQPLGPIAQMAYFSLPHSADEIGGERHYGVWEMLFGGGHE